MAKAILFPVLALVALTFAVGVRLYFVRVGAARAGRVKVKDFRLGESPEVPADVALPNRNLMNLLEMPVLFYVVSLACYVTHAVDGTTLGLAWGFVALRLVHSAIHLTFNHVGARFAAFAASNLVLLAMWIRLMVRVAWGD